MTKALLSLCSYVLILTLTGVSSFAQAVSVTCNDQINVAVNHTCSVDLSVDAFLEGDISNNNDVQNGYYTYEIYNHTGTIVLGGINGPTFGGDDLSAYINSFLFYKVYYQGTPTCWGTVLLEDKIVPQIECSICPQVNGRTADDYAPECILNCWERDILQEHYDIKLRDLLVQEDYEDFVDEAMSDNCNNWELELTSYYDRWTNFGPCVGARLLRTWTVGYYNYNNAISAVTCTREYFFRPIDLDRVKEYEKVPNTFAQNVEPIRDCILLPVEVIEIPCSEDVSPAGIASYFDNPETKDRDTDDDNVDPDELDVDLVIENNEGIPYGFPHYYQDGIGSGGPHPQPIDNEVCNILTHYTDNNLEVCKPGCLGNRKFIRQWTILDWCNSTFINYSQIIKAADNLGPEIDIPEYTASVDPWACSARVKLPIPEHIFDNCDNFYAYSIGQTGGYDVTGDAASGFTVWDVPIGTHQIEYLSEDCCGNIGRAYLNLTVVDNTPPVAVSKEFIVISLSNIGNPINGYQGTAKIFAWDLDNGSYDGCTPVSVMIRRDATCRNGDSIWGNYVTFCCEDLQGVASREIDVELKITDENGNENRVWSRVLLEDKSNSIPTIPPHMILTCDMDISDFDLTGGLPHYFGACGEAVVSCDTLEVIENTKPRELRLSDGVFINGVPQQAPAYDPSCGAGALRRVFKDCGGGNQWFIISPVDPFDNSSLIWPDDVVVDCDDYDNGNPDWLETTCNLVGVSVERDTFMFDNNSCMKILNHWSVINWCLYDPSNPTGPGKYTHTQLVKIIDSVDPEIFATDSLCYAVIDDCTSKDVVLSANAMDNGKCGGDWIQWEVAIDAYADWTEDYFYSSGVSRRLSNGDPNPFYIERTTNGEDALVGLPDGIPGSKIWHRAIWRAYDGCGNTASKMTYFQITDKKAPTPYCLNISTAVMENGQVELWAVDFDKGSFDNCSNSENLLFTFTNIAPPTRNDSEYDSNADLQWYNGNFWYYNSEELDAQTGAGEYEKLDDYGGEVHRWEPGLRSAGKIFTAADTDLDGFVEVPIYVWDECGNIDFCLVTLRLVDNGGGGQAMVAGTVATEFGEAVENITTEMSGPLNYEVEDLTDENGQYAFINTPYFSDYKLVGYKNDDYMNGISTLDLVLIQRHILGQKELDSPYKMIAADVNNDKQITAVDLLDLRKLILGVYSELPNNNSWKLINARQILDQMNPWNYEESITIEDLIADRMEEDFVGVKIGDVNGSVIANASMEEDGVKSKSSVIIRYDNQEIIKGGHYDINLTVPSGIAGMQFTMDITGLELIEISGLNISNDNLGVFDNKLSFSFHQTKALESDMNITLQVESKVNGNLSEILAIGSDITKAEAYDEESRIMPLVLENNSENLTFKLYQNTPNPFNESTNISFLLPYDSEVEFKFYDLTGRVVKTIKGQFPSGKSNISVKADDFPSSGMLYYSFEAENHFEIKQLVILK